MTFRTSIRRSPSTTTFPSRCGTRTSSPRASVPGRLRSTVVVGPSPPTGTEVGGTVGAISPSPATAAASVVSKVGIVSPPSQRTGPFPVSPLQTPPPRRLVAQNWFEDRGSAPVAFAA